MQIIDILREQINEMAAGVIASLPAIAVGILVLVLTWLVARGAGRIAGAIIGKAELRPSLRGLIDRLVRLAVWMIGLFTAAVVVIPDLSPASLVAGLGVGSVAIGFAFKDIFENFLAGILIMLRKKMQVGDTIECEGVLGTVEHIALRETYIRHFSGELTIMPNSMLFMNPVEIWTDLDARRYDVMVGVSYDTDLDAAEAAIRKAVQSVGHVIADRPIQVLAHEFNSSSVDFHVRWWAPSSGAATLENRDQVIRAIKRELDAARIEIPFPYVTHTFRERVPMGSNPGEAA
ncbi:mechanosensitive ion channel family protein [Erythrobacter sp. HL-111]|uniref:mechanosensitive ion channel family protein n=1 Tax=Erythrobacter sp. HL-111 TaxID=1798193 RepID=UPI0006DA40EC|nr:mechanosensitive ion channel family protein [Erythrobacter sp. HL-111]KPP96665.1 MAG: small conductance mechanosensitive ion channel [Erythrobacteraceae bacterium HL-111]SDR98198.1 Small-conductance mechanosensitive channel [Erythrobacter sp. HL-111]